MIRASSLFIVIIISFLIASITGSLVYVSFYYNMQIARHKAFNRSVHNIHSGITYLLSAADERMDQPVDLYADGEDSVYIRNKAWGVYAIGSVEAFAGSRKTGRQFMYGYTMNASQAAIRLRNSDRSLMVSGNTQITGDCFLPGGSAKSLVIEGYSYQGSLPIVKGKVHVASDAVFKVNSIQLNALNALLSLNLTAASGNLTEPKTGSDSLVQSFADSTLFLDFDDERLLSASYVKGNIVLVSSHALVLNRSMHLQDVIVVAPSVRVPSGFRGVVQVVCSDSIVLEEHARLDYPSSLVLLKNNGAFTNAHITLKKNAEVSGLVFAHSTASSDDKISVYLDERSLIKGQVYCSSSICAKGVVYGEAVCDHFILKENKNYLLNSVIDITKRSPHYIGSDILPVSGNKDIIKWL